jgi:hypothetical protein
MEQEELMILPESKPAIEGIASETFDRLRAYWNRKPLDRPVLHVRAKKQGYQAPPWNGPELTNKQKDLDPRWHAYAAGIALDSCEYLGDAIPCVGINFGHNLALLAVLSGGDYHYDRNGQTWVTEWPAIYDAPLPNFDPNHPVIKTLESCAIAMAEVVKNRGYINPPVVIDGMTLLSLFRTPGQLCMDLLDRPEEVKQWSHAFTVLGRDVFDHFYRMLADLGYGQCSSWIPIMAEGRFDLIQGDFGVMLSPAMYEEFFADDLILMGEYFDYTAYHLDGTEQMRFLDILAGIPHNYGIQWNPSPSSGPILNWMNEFREIQSRNMLLMFNEYEIKSAENAAAITRELGPNGLAFVLPMFDSAAEAKNAIRNIEQCCLVSKIRG